MTLKPLQYALIFVASCAIPTFATAQNVYKCGSSYSQTPCPGAIPVMVDDARDSAQKAQSDQATQRDMQLAQTLEKERLAQEKAALTPPVSKALSSRKVKKVAPSVDAGSTSQYPEVSHKITPKRLKSPAKKPAYFEAQVPGSEKKAASKKKSKKKVLAD